MNRRLLNCVFIKLNLNPERSSLTYLVFNDLKHTILNNTLSSELLLTASLCLWTGIIGDSLINVKRLSGEFVNSFEFVVFGNYFSPIQGLNTPNAYRH